MIEGPVTRDVIGKYIVFFNGCFAPRIVDISKDGFYISYELDGVVHTEHIMKFVAIIDNVTDKY